MANTWGNSGAAMFYILSNDSGVDNIYRDRIYPGIINTATTKYPALVFTILETDPTNTKGLTGTSKLDEVDIQIAAFHLTYSEMIAGQEAVRAALDYKLAGIYPPTGETVDVQSISFQSMRQDFDDDFGEQGVHISYMRFKLRQKRS